MTLVEALVARHGDDAPQLLAALRRHGVPAAAAVDVAPPAVAADERWQAAVAAAREHGERMQRALAVVDAALAPAADAATVTRSPLGPLWGRDVDVLVRPGRLADAEAALRAAGLIPLDPLLARVGRADASRHYGVIAEGEALAPVELSESGETDRLRRQAAKFAAARTATVRAALELGALAEERGADAVRRAAPVALRRCARLERELGVEGPATELARGLAPRPNIAWVRARIANAGVRARRLRGRRFVIAFSGIDGAGKSTQAARLTETLDRLGVPAVAVWGRIGYASSRLLSAAARAAQRVLPAGSHSAQPSRATGSATGSQPLTRRGVVGWSWALAVTLDHLRLVRAAVRRARGSVVVLDRAQPDALVDLEEGFGGKLKLRMHRRLVLRFSPRADVTFYLRLSGAAAIARKDDLFAAEVLQTYADRFDALAPRLGATVVDAERPAAEIARDVLSEIVERPTFSAP